MRIRPGDGITLDGDALVRNGKVIAHVQGGTGQTPLVLSLTEHATPWITQLLLRHVEFSNSGDLTPEARTVRFVVRDGNGGSSSPATTVVLINHAPILDTALNPRLSPTPEDAPTPASTLVSSLLTNAVTDPDANALRGIAVSGASNYHGTWQFSTNGGTSWQAMGEVSEAAARLLPGWSRVRFVPNADFHGTVKLYYRAWDQTQGMVGGTFDVRGNLGGAKAFSTAYENAALTVKPVNDPPRLVLGGTLGYVRDSSAITLAAGAIVSDVDSANFQYGRLRVRITDGASTSNRLAIGGGFTVDATGNVLQGTTIIGRRVGHGWGTSELVIAFNANATPTVAQQLARAITFKTAGGTAGKRTILFTISDGAGGVSGEAVKTVEVT